MPTTDDKLRELRERQQNLRRLGREAQRLAGGGYARHREDAARRSRQKSETGREIGPLPPVKDPERKAACRADLRLYAETYFPRRIRWKWSPSHLKDLTTLQRCALHGGLFAFSRPRGEGKTTLAEITALWASSYGWRKYVLVVAANDKPLAANILESLQFELEQNDLLHEDFPEICYPIRELEGIHQRSNAQTLDGERTRLEFTRDGIVFPRVKGSVCSGSIVEAVGISSAIRGRKHQLPDGTSIRPDFVLLDDPQTRDSAKSPTQTADRLSIIRGDILGLAGPDTPIAVVMPCTVIYPNDAADQLLDRDKSPQWQGRRTKRLLSWPKNRDLWEGEYREVRAAGLREGDGGAAGNAFYIGRRAEMDEGADVSWQERVKDGEVSAIQGAMNHYLEDPAEFFAEDQNEPLKDALTSGAKALNADAVAGRFNRVERYTLPQDATRLTCFIDVGGNVHWYGVVAWNERFGGTLIDYGPWPRQNRPHFAAGDPRPSLANLYPDMTEEQRVFAGLAALEAEVLGRTYYRIGGGEQRVELCLIDSGFLAKVVYQFVQRSPHSAILRPSKGIGRTATSRGVSEWKPRPGERAGLFWRLTSGEYGRTRAVQFDPDAWKSHLFSALTTPPGGATGLWLYGTSAEAHRMLGEHCAAEYSAQVTVRGTTFDKWEVLPHRPDNHLWDVLVGNAVAASVAGLEWTATGQPAPPKVTKGRTLAEMQADARRERAMLGARASRNSKSPFR